MLFEKLKKEFARLKENEPLASHSTFRVGGPADFFYELTNIEELPRLLTLAEENGFKYKLIGRGTNILFTDKGYRGLIIKNLTKEMRVDGDEITADSGVLTAQIVRLSVENNLSGLEPLYGLPGSIGAALWGNAGVPGVEIANFVKSATLFNVSDGVREVPRGELAMKYRHTSLQQTGDVVMRVILKLKKGFAEASKELMKRVDEIRRGKQPTGYSAGSFFKNPLPEKPAGYLIDKAGLKGTRVGGAEISMKHANFFMNCGNATAAEILELGRLAQKKVKEKFGIDLEMEVKVVGET